LAALSGELGGANAKLSTFVSNDAATAYVDGTRFTTKAKGTRAYGNERALTSVLQGRSFQANEKATDGLVDLLHAARLPATTAVGDLDASLRYSYGSGRGKPAPAKELQAKAKLKVARAALAAGKSSLKRAKPVAAVDSFMVAWASALGGLSDVGITEKGDADKDGVSDRLELGFNANPFAADSDGDGLTDRFEIDFLFGISLPAAADSDRDGVRDDAEDLDQDGLTALREQTAKTTPTETDTDADGLTDGEEVAKRTKPTVADTDRDGLLDGAEPGARLDPLRRDTDRDGTPDGTDVASRKVSSVDGIAVSLVGTGDLARSFDVARVAADAPSLNAPGLIGSAYEFYLDPSAKTGLRQAELIVPFRPGDLGGANPQDLRLFHLNESTGTWELAAQQQKIDSAGHTVTATVTHFSTYAIFDINNWNATWTAEDGPCKTRDDDGTDIVLLDLALVLDSSGSMADNDPTGLRRQGAKAFVDALLAEDRTAVVDFDDSATVLQGLTTDKAAVKAAIDNIDESGGTNLGAGIAAALDVLRAAPDGDDRARMVIMLTDGQGSYDASLTAAAKNLNVTVYTIGLGSSVDHALLQSIANGTGGQYHHVASAAELPEVFRSLSQSTDSELTKDTDGDGLTDCEELDLQTQVYNGDSDGDGLPDATEVHGISTDPLVQDTDGDTFSDSYEDAHRSDQGLDPLNPDPKIGKWTYAVDFAKGAIAGDLWREDSLAWLAGNLTSGASSFIPVVGWIVGGVADLRDAVGSAIHADWVGAGLSVVGVLPYAGDAVAIPGKALAFALRNADKTDEVLAFVAKIDDVPQSVKTATARGILGPRYQDLISAGATDASLNRLAAGRGDLKALGAVVSAPGVKGVVAPFFATGRDGEKFLEGLYGAGKRGTDAQVWFSTKDFLSKGRYVDVFVGGVMRESKVGYVRYSARIEAQILKDAHLVRKGEDGVTGAHWHFLPSGRSNSVGADERVLKLLRDNNIPYTIHLPQ
jgi:Mg-chelatase subunit ChlD